MSVEAVRPQRALALDALRGIAIILMCLSGRVPFGQANLLPRWMYHAQEFPGLRPGEVHPAGFTWVDFVFPMFLFSMGVAFPFAQASRLQKGASTLSLEGSALVRGFLIAVFAIYFQHIVPYSIDATATINALRAITGQAPQVAASGNWSYVFAFLGFLSLLPVYTRLPESIPQRVRWMIRVAGILECTCLLVILRYEPDSFGTSFDLHRSNIILLVLANMAFFGTTVWLLTRGSWMKRVAFLALFYPFFECAIMKDTGLNILLTKPFGAIDWLYSMNFLKYLFIVVPATIVGDDLLAWMKSNRAGDSNAAKIWAPVACLAGSVVVGAHVMLQERWIFAAQLTALMMIVGMELLAPKSETSTNVFLRKLMRWGSFWLMMGLLFEPVVGGIRKDPSNMSYYFVTLGLSILLLLVLTVIIDLAGRRRVIRPVVDTGQNPMAAYTAINNVMEPLIVLLIPALAFLSSHLMNFTNSIIAIPYPWHLFVWALFKTALLVAIASMLTRLKIIWRT